MGDIVNLKRVRKSLQRKDATALAAANRLRFGQTKVARADAEEGNLRAARLHDGHLLPGTETS